MFLEESDEGEEELSEGERHHKKILTPSEEKKDDAHQLEVLKHEQELKKAQ